MFSRYGLREGFKNVELKKVHDASTAFMNETPICVHENVPDYEEVGGTRGTTMMVRTYCMSCSVTTIPKDHMFIIVYCS